MPTERSFSSSSALPPVSPASVVRVSCWPWKLAWACHLRAAGPHAGGAGRALGGVAQGSRGHQAAGVDGVERHIGLHGGVHGGGQLRLVIAVAVARHAAGEVDQRLLFRQRAEHLGRGFESRQLAVGIEDVEFGIVRREGRAGVGGGVALVGDAKPWPSPTVRFLMSLMSLSRSSVKSSTTLTSEENVMMATRSDGVICVLTNLTAESWARIWSLIGMEVMSKNSTIRRRSLYFTSPALAGVI
jgi:hypothetical protein